jgi:hypothetical protein
MGHDTEVGITGLREPIYDTCDGYHGNGCLVSAFPMSVV